MAGGDVRAQGVQPADRIWLNGRIVTMDAAGAIVEAVAVRGGEIVAAGSGAAIAN